MFSQLHTVKFSRPSIPKLARPSSIWFSALAMLISVTCNSESLSSNWFTWVHNSCKFDSWTWHSPLACRISWCQLRDTEVDGLAILLAGYCISGFYYNGLTWTNRNMRIVGMYFILVYRVCETFLHYCSRIYELLYGTIPYRLPLLCKNFHWQCNFEMMKTHICGTCHLLYI